MKRSVIVGFAALMASSVAFAQGAADSVMVHDPYVRAVPPGQPNSAAFMTLMNNSGAAHTVVGGSSPASKVVELHTHIHEGGMMKMRRVERIDVAANGQTELKPGGLHVMLIGLKQDLKAGDKVSVTLKFEDGSEKVIDAPVREVAQAMQMQMGGGMGQGDQNMHNMHSH